jgi:hypothetical protein
VNTGPDDDWDADGLSNFAEYAFGTDPKAANDATRLPHVWLHTNGKLRIKHARLKGATDFDWSMHQRPDFDTAWAPINPADFTSMLVTDRLDGTEDVTWEYQPSLGSGGFYKVLVIRNP